MTYHRVPEISPRALWLWGEVSFVGACALIFLEFKTCLVLLRALLHDSAFPTLWVVSTFTLTFLWYFQYGYRRALLS